MTTEEIKKNAPIGATHYKLNKYCGVIYLKLIGSEFHYCFNSIHREPLSYSEEINSI